MCLRVIPPSVADSTEVRSQSCQFPLHCPHRMALRDPKQRQARALKMLEMKMMAGKTDAEVAKAFGVNPATVQKAMSLARKGDLVVSFEDKLMNELLPLAHEAMKTALTDGNAKIALEVFKGAGIIRPHTGATQPQLRADQDLAAYITRKRHHALLEEQTIDAESHPTEPRSLPEAAQPPDPTDHPSDGPRLSVSVAGSGEITPPPAPSAGPDGPASPETHGPDDPTGGDGGLDV